MQTRKLSLIALFSALAFVLMVFISVPLIPTVPFLKIDLSFIPIFMGMMLLDLKSGYLILLIRSLLKLLLNNSGVNDYIGLPMNIVGFMILMTVLYYCLTKNKWHSWIQKGLAVVFGMGALTIVMVVLNYVYAIPLYAQFANFNIGQVFGVFNYLLLAVVPFNLLEGLILVGLSLLILPFVRRLIAMI
nr:ECF transporter S component [Weissella coleopterorum]